jgi:hypothetical protein
MREIFSSRRQNLRRPAHDLQVFLVGADAVEDDMLVVIEFLLGGHRDGDGVADRHRSRKMQGLVDQDGAGAGKLGAEHRGDQRSAPHAVGHDLAEHAAFANSSRAAPPRLPSPDRTANSLTSSGISVRERLAQSPMRISS